MAQEITPLQEVQGTLAKMSDQFRMCLPKHISPDKFIRAAQTAVQNNPDLLQCSRPSLYNACMKCAQDGLLADGREAAIVKFGGEAAYLPMVGGILKLIRNSGELATIDAEVVHEKDEYDSWVDERGQHFKFKKARGERGAPLLTFAYAIMKDGALYFEEVSEQEMAGIQKVARSQTVWTGAFRDEMKKKSAIHRMAKRMPKSTDLESVLKHDEELYDLEKPAEPTEKPTTSSKLNAAVVGQDRTGVEDAAIVEPSKTQPETPAPVSTPVNPPRETVKTNENNKIIKAVLIEKINTKKSEPGAAKAWTKFGGLVSGKWYGTFDGKFADIMQKSVKDRALVNIEFTETVKNDQVYNNIVNIEISNIKDCQEVGEIPFDDVPS